jgi:hemerythrin-like domain-containing protein
MKAIELLREDHRLMHRLMGVVVKCYSVMKEKQRLDKDLIADFLTFFREFVDCCHYGKEEGMFFDELERLGGFSQQLPIESIRQDHRILRFYVGKIGGIMENKEIDEEARFNGFVENMNKLMEHAVYHSKREDRVFYPLGDRILTEESDEKLLVFFDKVDKRCQGSYEKYARFVDNLEKKYGLDESGKYQYTMTKKTGS